MLIIDDSRSKGYWNLVQIENPIMGAFGLIREVIICVPSRVKGTTTLRHPLTQLYPMEINCSQEIEGDVDNASKISD